MKDPRLLLSCLVGLSIAPLGALFAAASIEGCSNHDALAPDPDAGTSSHAASSASGTTSSGAGAGGAAPVEPDGPTRLTLVDGIVDAPAAAFCFAAYPSGVADRPPFPAGGLPFGHASVVALPSTDVPSGDVLLTVVTGDLGSIGGASCADLVADPASHPTLSLTSMGVLPASTLAAPRSLLLGPIGCLGGPGHEDPNGEAICGKGYTKDDPTVTLLVAPLSRITLPTRVAFQGVNATTAMKKADFYLRPSFDGSMDRGVVSALSSGGVGPFPPYTGLGAADLGSVGGADVGVAPTPSGTPAVRAKLADAYAAAGLSSADVLNGRGFAIVAVGPTPGLAKGTWWNDPAFVAVAVDPGAP